MGSSLAGPATLGERLLGGDIARPRTGTAALSALGAAITLMIIVCGLGPSDTVPATGGGLHLGLRPPVAAVVALDWTLGILGALGVCLGLLALRRGWRPVPRRLLQAGLLALVLLAVLPMAGSTDVLSYALYGRMGALGLDPAATTPWRLIRLGDPVAAYAPLSWRDTPSVYGPVANWTFHGAALLGGTSMFKITLVMKLLTGAAFGLIALGLDRLAGPDPLRRARVHLLWTLNPLMIWAVVVGAHVDGLAAACVVGALVALHATGERALPGTLLAGALLGAAAGIKAPYALAGLGLAWGLRRAGARAAALLAGLTGTLGLAYLLAGPAALHVLTSKTGTFSPINPYHWPLHMLMGEHWTSAPIGLLGLIAGILMAALLARRLPPGLPDLPVVRPMFVLCAAWLITSPLQRSWYDVMIFPLLALLPANRMDGVLVVRAMVGGLASMPGVLVPGPGSWTGVARWADSIFVPWRVSAGSLTMVGVIILSLALPMTGRRDRAHPG